MNGLVLYLVSLGFTYEEYSRQAKDNIPVARPTGYFFHMVKGGERFVFGLNERGFPPTLCEPRPVLEMVPEDQPDLPAHTAPSFITGEYSYPDALMGRVFESHSPEAIYRAVASKTPLRLLMPANMPEFLYQATVAKTTSAMTTANPHPRMNTAAEMMAQRHTEYLAIEEAANQRKQNATGARMDEAETLLIRRYWLEAEQVNIGEWMRLGLGLPGVVEELHQYSEIIYRELSQLA